ncbi:MAG: hypothetical protein IT334_03360 [Thermomicrobiales bacterium]|nr:hypothetical protein [Thermomicrobiales bacterium]
MLDNYQFLIDELLSAPKLVRDTIAAHGGEAPPAVLGLIALLSERDALVLERLNRVKREQYTNLRALPDLADAEPAAVSQSLEDLLRVFDTNRGELVSLLMNLTLKEWEKKAAHELLGETTLADEVEVHVDLDEAIRARIEATLG